MKVDLHVERPRVIWRQVADQIRKQITSGQLPAGSKMPTTAEIARQSGTDVKTVHRALTHLVQEGLISRARKVGTYVMEREVVLSLMGIYYPTDIHAPHSLFLQSLHSELQRQAHERNIGTRVWMDYRPGALQNAVLPELEEAARERHIQGLVATVADERHMEWLKKMRVPVAYIGGELPTSVLWDINEFIMIAIRELRRQKCRSCGIITPFRRSMEPFYKALRDECAANGITIRDEWIIAPPEEGFVAERDYESLGYQAFMDLWSCKSRPDGLLIYPDSLARGVIMAAMSLQIETPKDLKLVIHKNEEVGLFCPLSATFITSSVRETATTLLERLDDRFHGRPTKTTFLHFQVERSLSWETGSGTLS